jgi:hypothetical protein
MTTRRASEHASGSNVDRASAAESAENLPAQLTEAELVRVEATTTSLVDKLIDELSPLAEAGIEAFKEDRERRAEIQKRQIETAHDAMKRHSWLLGGAIASVFGLSLAALLLREVNFAQLVLSSALAIAAGAGLTAMTGKKKE